MKDFRYFLKPYRKSSDRHICPKCGRKGEFAYYIDAVTGKPLHPSVGKCNREQKCGYHYTPAEFFRDNPDKKQKDDWMPLQQTPKQEKSVQYLSNSFLMQDKCRDKNNLFRFMEKEFGTDEANRVFDAYHVGTSRHWRNDGGFATSFPQIDERGNLRQIKVMAYHPSNGKRMKKQDEAELWNDTKREYFPDTRPMDKIWFAGKTLLKDYEAHLRQTFFGCHLIEDADRVGLVESEKTALICAILMPGITWVATGGSNGCKFTEQDVFQPLIGKRVVLYPDAGMLEKWGEKASILMAGGVNVSVSRVCEGMASNTDIADVLLRERKPIPKPATIGDVCRWMAELGIEKKRITFNL